MTGEERQTGALRYIIAAIVCGVIAGGVFVYVVAVALLKMLGLL